ncbi:MAG: dethiobiotin synthase, partial [Planctomycetota bacterium]
MQSKPTPIPALSVVPRPTFVVGTDTEVGKTYQACRLVQALGRAGKSVGVYKPVLSGVVDGAGESGEHGSDDGSLLLQASGQRWPFARVCPQVFAAPVAPPVAARLEAKQVDESMLVDGLHWWSGRCDALVVEGAGGVLSPISETMTILDLAATSSARIIIVAANRLGVVNHTLLTLEAVRSRNLEI